MDFPDPSRPSTAMSLPGKPTSEKVFVTTGSKVGSVARKTICFCRTESGSNLPTKLRSLWDRINKRVCNNQARLDRSPAFPARSQILALKSGKLNGGDEPFGGESNKLVKCRHSSMPWDCSSSSALNSDFRGQGQGL